MAASSNQKLTLALLLSVWVSSLIFVFPLGTDIAREIAAQFHPPAHPVRVSGPCDFTMFWSVGQMIAAGQVDRIFNVHDMLAWEAANAANDGLQLPWFYPPPGLLLAGLVQRVAFFPAFLAWELGIFLLSILLLRLAALPWAVIIAAALSPAALLSMDLGQLGFLTGALSIAALLLVEARPALSGALFGALIYKPQAGVLAPVVFLASRQWRGMGAGAMAATALCALTLGLYGTVVWHEFITQGLPVSKFILVEPFPNHPPPIPSSDEFYGISVFWMFRSFGCGLPVSYAAQGLAALAAVALCFRAWAMPRADALARVALTACLGLLITPYGFLYDLSVCSIAFAALAWRERRLLFSDVLLWVWPAVSLIIALKFYLELSPLVLALSIARTWRRLDP